MKSIILVLLSLFSFVTYGQDNQLFINIFDKWNNALMNGNTTEFTQYLVKHRVGVYEECMKEEPCAEYMKLQALKNYEVISVSKIDNSYQLTVNGTEVSENVVEGKISFSFEDGQWKIRMSEWKYIQ